LKMGCTRFRITCIITGSPNIGMANGPFPPHCHRCYPCHVYAFAVGVWVPNVKIGHFATCRVYDLSGCLAFTVRVTLKNGCPRGCSCFFHPPCPELCG
jgi:hypothetical protein